jgi:hypothetical protein
MNIHTKQTRNAYTVKAKQKQALTKTSLLLHIYTTAKHKQVAYVAQQTLNFNFYQL